MTAGAGFGALGEAQLVELYRLARRAAAGIVPSPEADDVAADTIERLLRRERTLRGHPSLEGWVVLTARRRALDLGRGGAGRTVARAEPVPGGHAGFEDDVVARMAIESALAALPARQAEAMRLRYLDGLPESEVAAAMGLSGGAVKSHLRRGRRALEGSWPTARPAGELHPPYGTSPEGAC